MTETILLSAIGTLAALIAYILRKLFDSTMREKAADREEKQRITEAFLAATQGHAETALATKDYIHKNTEALQDVRESIQKHAKESARQNAGICAALEKLNGNDAGKGRR